MICGAEYPVVDDDDDDLDWLFDSVVMLTPAAEVHREEVSTFILDTLRRSIELLIHY